MPITTTRTFVPIAIDIVQEIFKRRTSITCELNETNYLFQWLSIAIQWGMQCNFETFPHKTANSTIKTVSNLTIFKPTGFVLVSEKNDDDDDHDDDENHNNYNNNDKQDDQHDQMRHHVLSFNRHIYRWSWMHSKSQDEGHAHFYCKVLGHDRENYNCLLLGSRLSASEWRINKSDGQRQDY